jgi:hypothetical protein
MTLFAVIFVVFVVLKVSGLVAWPWWLVGLPLVFDVILSWFFLSFLACVWKDPPRR